MDNLLLNITDDNQQPQETLLTNYNENQNKLSYLDALKKQYELEEHNSRLYKQFAIWLKTNKYKSYSVWEKYSNEEQSHANKILDFFIINNISFMLPQISEIVNNPSSLYDVINLTYQAEMDNMCNLKAMYSAVKNTIESNHDMYLLRLCEDMIIEQNEEINKALSLVDISTRTGDLLHLDEYISNNY